MMRKQNAELIVSLLFFLLVLSHLKVGCSLSGKLGRSSSYHNSISKLTPKAHAIRYWDSHVSKKVGRPEFLLNKASPLTASESARFTQLAAQNSLSTQLDSFCESARLLCFRPHNNSMVGPPNTSLVTGKFTSWTKIFTSWTKSYSSQGLNISSTPTGFVFREKMLKEGTIMPMPDIQDKFPPRSFLPPSILSNIPFSSSKITQLNHIFHALNDYNHNNNFSMASILNDALHECERAQGPGEIKRCVGSLEDMIDFAVSVLGRSTEPRFTQNTYGSNRNILIGKVVGINGGKVTNSVSCHQMLYPYLLYYCHSLPKVRVYEADILDSDTKVKINHGVAICHIDTSAWSPTNLAFQLLRSGPGRIEVCHWIFENDLTWVVECDSNIKY